MRAVIGFAHLLLALVTTSVVHALSGPRADIELEFAASLREDNRWRLARRQREKIVVVLVLAAPSGHDGRIDVGDAWLTGFAGREPGAPPARLRAGS
ncbi:MAG: hypothetical protein QM778_28395 [Myxococcales bacterium]